MPRDTESIEREIERARDELASTLDELTVRANPKRLVDTAKQAAFAKLNEPPVRYGLIGAGVLAVVIVAVKIFR
ncbi:DUF3618 domain-containing protein [Rhodococcus sp. D2-41]|uniref:DUF3618 domain-containing protein n=1 Tax=Speluncibacter jeojiensis TaxID=2710754 RepID=A0A9X4LVP9_9ACTN|nr:DUF3618 domain-containing protein [Rhodococcus sp. D2-41]MDG3008624.1 DUF3618 domain-containing protein [Rhodococcus sp. D2-41]MDG3013168.1 DUF3618 domain-containing protein [Corynebacteriales bacterium D3-21]